MTALTPTREQRDIVDAALSGEELIVQAGAGTGKSSTLRLIGEAVRERGRRGTYVAFNKSVATEAQNTFPGNIHAATSHSIAMRQLRNSDDADVLAKLNGQGRIALSRAISAFGVRALSVPTKTGLVRLSSVAIARAAAETVAAYCASSAPKIDPVHVPTPTVLGGDREARAHFGEVVMRLASKMWRDILDPRSNTVQFQHSHYLKMWALRDPILPPARDGILMLDEAQDTSGVLAGVIARQTHVQRIIVGDTSQAIYGWAGAIDVMDGRDFAITRQLCLTQSWRFGPEIAAAANNILDALSAPLRLSGNDAIDSQIVPGLDFGRGGDAAVLCRTNAGMISAIITETAAGRSVHLRGNNKDAILAFLNGAEELQARARTDQRDLAGFTSWTQVQEYVDEDPSGADLKTLVSLIDTYSVAGLRAAVQGTVNSAADADVTVSTCHTAKGLEWADVRIAHDFEITDEVNREALMLAYVSVTRARHRLDPGPLADLISGRPVPAPAATRLPRNDVARGRAEHPFPPEEEPLTITVNGPLAAELRAAAPDPQQYVTRLLHAALATANTPPQVLDTPDHRNQVPPMPHTVHERAVNANIAN